MSNNVSNETIPEEEPTPETEPPVDENAEEKMTNSWEAARASLGSLSGSSSSGNSNITLRHEPHHSKQKQPTRYNAPSGPVSLSALIEAAGPPPPPASTLELVNTEPYDYFDTTVNAAAIAERTNSLRRLRRAGYANRSFMYHGEYPPIAGGMLDDGYDDDTVGPGGGGGRLPYYVEPTYRSLEYDRRQRRRHSVHQLANFNPSSKLDDLRQRFDEYSSSAAVPRGAYYGYYTLDRHKSRQSSRPIVATNPLPPPAIAYGKAFSFGQSARAYSGSRSLDRVLVEEERDQRKGPKRGSRSSQGSTDSNNSTQSASSGSLLLTVANLENFAKIHRKSTAAGGGSKLDGGAGSSSNRTLERYLSSTLDLVPHPHPGTLGRRSRYNSNILLQHQDVDDHHPADHAAIDYRKDSHHIVGGGSSSTAIVPIDEISIDEGEGGSERQLQLAGVGGGGAGAGGGHGLVSPFRSIKGKDPDTVSVASSTHFTMVNGIGGPQRVIKTGICSSGGHQITILIITMSIIFMIGICSAVFLLEMRAREMPK